MTVVRMTDVYWLEQSEADIPPDSAWLSASEAARVENMRFAKRRTDWLLGRWTAKCALATYLRSPAHLEALAGIEVRPAPSGAPDAFLDGEPVGASISLSHRAGVAICAVATAGVVLGCDLELIEPRAGGFAADYFTSQERALLATLSADDRPAVITLLWSAKESVLKALREGLRLDTRCVAVDLGESSSFPAQDRWSPFQICHSDRRVFHGWWRQRGALVRTMVSTPPPAPPIELERPVEVAKLERVTLGCDSNPTVLPEKAAR